MNPDDRSTGEPTRLFRDEALEYHSQGHRLEGDLIRLSPAWLIWTAWLLLAVGIAVVFFAIFGTIHEYASGPAVVRAEGRTDVTTLLDGTVSAVEVQPGQRVASGAVLARFDAAQEAAEFHRANGEFELHLVRLLRDASDQAARQALTTLAPQREHAARRLEERTVRAPHAGIVSDVRIRPGQRLAAGQVVASLLADTRFSLLVLLPGHARPLLKPGTPLRLELAGYRYAYQTLQVDSIGDELIGPGEARRYLGPELGDAVPVGVQGPVVLVKTDLPSTTFEADGTSFPYYDGLLGTAEVAVRTERILFAIVPALKGLFGNGRS